MRPGALHSRKGENVRGTPLALALLVGTVGLAPPAAAQSQAPPEPRAERPAPAMPTGTNPFLAGVPSGAPTPGAMSLSIAEAIARALEHNLGALTADAAVE